MVLSGHPFPTVCRLLPAASDQAPAPPCGQLLPHGLDPPSHWPGLGEFWACLDSLPERIGGGCLGLESAEDEAGPTSPPAHPDRKHQLVTSAPVFEAHEVTELEGQITCRRFERPVDADRTAESD